MFCVVTHDYSAEFLTIDTFDALVLNINLFEDYKMLKVYNES